MNENLAAETSVVNAPPEILIVEDSRLQAKVLQDLLSANGYRARVALNGAQGLAMARERRPALVLCDIVMPVMDGYAMCSHFKNEANLRDVPVILLTSLANLEDVVLGLESRADLYLTKPYNAGFLLSMVEETLRFPPTNPREYSNGDAPPIDFFIAGKKRTIHADRRQILNLLLSTYGNAVEQNRALLRAQSELQDLHDQLHEHTRQIVAQQRELEDANARLRNLATYDGLTGLKNHTAFKNRLSEEVILATETRRPLSLLMMDVDFFKQFNDTFGHPAGDGVLQVVAQTLSSECRAEDFLARYGGEEFAVLLPDTPRDTAIALAERLRLAVEHRAWPLRPISISVGAATFRNTHSTPDTEFALLEAADQALYSSKHRGRNCTSHAADLA